MKINIQIDDDLLRALQQQARREDTSLAEAVDRALRQGMETLDQTNTPARPFREKTFFMGKPKVDLDRALALAAAMEDGETLAKLWPVRKKMSHAEVWKPLVS